jgi:FAD/FMN-containing dehydrogenase
MNSAVDIAGIFLPELPAEIVTLGPEVPERYHADWSGVARVRPLALLRPRTTAEVQACLRACYRHNLPVVPQGGLTGLAGGAQPHPRGVAISLERLRRIEAIDPFGLIATVEAGVVLQDLQAALRPHKLLFGVDLAPRGSCQIGGMLAANAGGQGVVQFGTMRAQVLGLEVVLADGSLLSMLRPLYKNNTGYDLNQMFVGSEGTLGIITKAVLRLHPAPAQKLTGFLAFDSFAEVLALLRDLHHQFPGRVAAFELMWADFLDAVRRHAPVKFPFGTTPPMAVLFDIAGGNEADAAALEALLGKGFEQGRIQDGTLATSIQQAEELWRIRESVAEIFAQTKPINFDLSLPIPKVQEFIGEARAAIARQWPELPLLFFGHLGDGNLHIIADAAYLPAGDTEEDVQARIYAVLRGYNGAITAEHGVGSLRVGALTHDRSVAELAAMRAIKAALDPRGILNPGKVFAAQ